MDGTPVHIDEFGTVRFTLLSEQGISYEFEQEADSTLLFITVRSPQGRAEMKRVVDTEQTDNREIVETYTNYIKEQDDKRKDEEQ